MTRKTLATVWLDGCSGCHMSLLDTDERLLVLLERADLVYSPLVDAKTFPEMVDVTLVEGSVSTEDDLARILKVREHTRILVSLGDCAVTGNVPAMRNTIGRDRVLARACLETATHTPQVPARSVPRLLPRVRPVHDVVAVDVFLPGCPPAADAILETVLAALEGREPAAPVRTRFGA